jgi:hypothetical protein
VHATENVTEIEFGKVRSDGHYQLVQSDL